MLIQLENQNYQPKPRSVFYSYSHKDEDLRDELDTHLKLLKREGFISTWYDRKIPPGDQWDHVINENLNTAEVILFLVSQNFLASQYCRDIEMQRAMERSEKHEAIVIPIILKPCVWTSEPFARLQALPKNCRPLVEWPDTGFARVAEELRAMMVNLIYPRMPDGNREGQHGQWIMKLRNRPEVDDDTHAQQIVWRLREFTEDFSINLLATTTTQISDGEKIDIGLMLILSGTPEAFSKISTAQQEGQLTERVDKDIISFYVVYGATVKGSSSIPNSIDLSSIEDQDLVLRPGRKISSSFMKGLIIPNSEKDDFHFIINRGDFTFADEDAKRFEYQQLSDYFYTSLVVKDEFQWVNLSAYESDRMLPPELSGTEMGRNLLSQDCMLKRLTASFMHPDSPTGQAYWTAVYKEAHRLFGTSKLPFYSFQKLTILPIDALVYVPENPLSLKETLSITVPPDATFAYVIKNILDVRCEEDLVAKLHSDGRNEGVQGTDFTLNIFRDIVLPKIKEEVNEGEHFAEIRRIYSAMVLAAWLKRELQQGKNERLRKLVDTGKAANRFTISKIKPLVSDKTTLKASSQSKRKEAQLVGPAIRGASAFKVPENVEFYAQYIKLFKDGVFRCARGEVGDSPEERVNRVYFSGAVDFRNMSAAIKCVCI